MSAGYSSAVLFNRPLRYYRLGDANGSTAKDSGSQAQDGTIHGGVTLGQVGLIKGDSDTCMLFDGTSGYISAPTTGLPTGVASWTVEAWIQFSAIPGAGNYPVVFTWGTRAANQEVAFYFDGDTGNIALAFQTTDMAGGNLQTNTPYHLVGTYDGTTALFYVNAIQKATRTVTLNIGTDNLAIGTESLHTLFWTKYIDEMAVYGNALTANQITHNYTVGIAANYSGGGSRRLGNRRHH